MDVQQAIEAVHLPHASRLDAVSDDAWRRRMIIGISGASGIIYGITALKILASLGYETHLVISRSARQALVHEGPFDVREIEALAGVVHQFGDIGASISSGSFRTRGMLIAPCSIKTLSEIAYGTTSSLLTRAADVILKERRRLVLMVRETPLHLGHLRAMTMVTEAGGIIMPPVPAFYPQPDTLEEMIAHTVGRALDLFDIDYANFPRWGE